MCTILQRYIYINPLINFSYLFGIQLGQLILQHTENLGKTLQSPTFSASEAQRIASMVVATLQTVRDKGQFDLLWKTVENHSFSLDVEESKRKFHKDILSPNSWMIDCK